MNCLLTISHMNYQQDKNSGCKDVNVKTSGSFYPPPLTHINLFVFFLFNVKRYFTLLLLPLFGNNVELVRWQCNYATVYNPLVHGQCNYIAINVPLVYWQHKYNTVNAPNVHWWHNYISVNVPQTYKQHNYIAVNVPYEYGKLFTLPK